MNIQPKGFPQEGSEPPNTQNLNGEENAIQEETKLEQRYVDLASTENRSLRNEIVKENFRYASYLYMGAQSGNRATGDEHGILLSTSNKISKLNGVQSLSKSKKTSLNEKLNCLKTIENRLKSPEFGFKVDDKGNYYNLETGTIFNLVFDHQRNELVIAFVGLNYQDHLQATEAEKNTVRTASFTTAFNDFTGTLPTGVRQCIEIGRMIKEVIGNIDIEPVMIGHSHGGGLAQASALANNLKGIIINSRSLGAQTRAFIGENVIERNTRNITAFSVRGDWLTEAKKIEDLKPAFETMLKTNAFIAVIFELIKHTPISPNIGQGYYLPQPEGSDAMEAHRHFYKAFQLLR